jgi:hypothetical protein
MPASQWDIPSYVGGTRVAGATPVEYAGTPSLLADPMKLAAGNLGSALKGELPDDVKQMLAQRAAELGISSGTSGSEFNNFRSLRDLGLTSLDRMDKATAQLLPHFITPYQSANLGLAYQGQAAAENEAFQRRNAAQFGRGPIAPETSAPLYQSRANPTAPTLGAGRVMPSGGGSDINSIIAELGQKYGPGTGFGMAPMGSGSVPSFGGSWNAGPLDTGQGNFFAGDPTQLSPEELFAYGLDQPSPNPMTASDFDYLNYGDTG